MEHYAVIDVSLEFSSVCIVDVNGQTLKEAKVTSEPDALMAFLGEAGFSVTRIGLEAGPLSQSSLSQICACGTKFVIEERSFSGSS
jgi:transposase